MKLTRKKKIEKFYVDFKKRTETKENRNILQELTGLSAEADSIKNLFSLALNKPITESPSLGNAKVGNAQSSPSFSLAQDRVKAKHTELEMRRAQTEQAMMNADKSRDRQLEANRQLMEISLELQKIDAEVATQEEILKILQEGIQQLAKLRTQWSNLLLFFTDISNKIKFGMHPQMLKFVKHSEIIKVDKEAGMAITKAAIDQIYKPCIEAVKIGYLVHNLSSVYVEISTNHIMPMVSSLSENLALDPDDKRAIKRQKAEVDRKTKEMQEEIMKYIRNKTENYKRKVGERMQEIDETFDKFIPAISVKEKAAIKEEVTQNVEEAKKLVAVNYGDYI